MGLIEQDRGGTADDARQASPGAARTVARRDVFISHASEDKDAIARPLAQRLRAQGCSVWFDEYELVLGDSLRTKIGDGLRHSQVGVVILSRSFFAKRWAQWELDGLTARHIAGEQNVILPVCHEVGLDDVRSYSPPLADLVAAKSSDGVEAVADSVVRVLRECAAGSAPSAALSAGAYTPRRRRYLTPRTLRGALSIAVALIAIAALLTGTHPFGDGDDGKFVSSSVPRSRLVTFILPSGYVRTERPPRNEVADCWRFRGSARLRAGRTLMIGAQRIKPPDDRTYYQKVTWTGADGRRSWWAERYFGSEVGQTYRVSVVAIPTRAVGAAEKDQTLPRSADVGWLRPDLLHKFEGSGNCLGGRRAGFSGVESVSTPTSA